MNLNYDSGIYLLELKLNQTQEIKIGAKGIFSFPAGYYYYCGTAQKNLKTRLKRHHSEDKNFHWHIDYLLDSGDLTNVFTWPLPAVGECSLARYLENWGGEIIVEGFGASDCNCDSHLFLFEKSIVEKINSLTENKINKK